MREPHPPLSVLRRFVHLLNQSQQDFLAEAELLRLQEQVVRRIRSNQQLERDLALVDTKIGLLVKSRATLQVRPPAPAAPGARPVCCSVSSAAWLGASLRPASVLTAGHTRLCRPGPRAARFAPVCLLPGKRGEVRGPPAPGRTQTDSKAP